MQRDSTLKDERPASHTVNVKKRFQQGMDSPTPVNKWAAAKGAGLVSDRETFRLGHSISLRIRRTKSHTGGGKF